MRISRVIIFGAVIAAAVAGGSAFTAGNALEDNTVAGYDNTTVTGATVTNIAYNPDVTDPSKLASVVFTATGDITDTASTMMLQFGGSTVGAGASTCADVVAGSDTAITCTLTTPLDFVAFDGVALTVVSE